MTEDELSSIKDIGPRSIVAIKSRLAVYGWKLKETIAAEEAVSTTPEPALAPAPLGPVTLDSPIERLELTLYYPGLGLKANRALKAANIITIRQLVNMREDKLGDIKNIGPTIINAIKNRLAQYGWNIIEMSPEEILAERKRQQDEEEARLERKLAEKEKQMKDRGQRLYSIRKQLGLSIGEFCFVLSPSGQKKQKFSESMSTASSAHERAIPYYESGEISIPDWLLNRAEELAKAPEVAKELLAQLAQAEVQAVEVEKIIAEKKARAEKLDSLFRKIKFGYQEIGMILRPADPLCRDDVVEFTRGKVDIPDWVMVKAEELAQALPESIEDLVETAKREEKGRYDSAFNTLRHKFETAGYAQRDAELLIAQIWIEERFIHANTNAACRLMDTMAQKIISLKIGPEEHEVLRGLFELALHFSRNLDNFDYLLANINDTTEVVQNPKTGMETRVKITALKQLQQLQHYTRVRGVNCAQVDEGLEESRLSIARELVYLSQGSKPALHDQDFGSELQLSKHVTLSENKDGDSQIEIVYSAREDAGRAMFSGRLLFNVYGNTMRIGVMKETFNDIERLNPQMQSEADAWSKELLSEAIKYAKSHGIMSVLLTPPFAQYCAQTCWNRTEIFSDATYRDFSALPYDLGFRLQVADKTTFSRDHLEYFSRMRWQKTLHARSTTEKSATASIPDQKSEDTQAQPSSEISDDVLEVSADTANKAAKAADIATNDLATALDDLPEAGFIPIKETHALKIVTTSIANMDERLTQTGPITSPEIAELFLKSIEEKLTTLEKITAQLESLKLTADEYYQAKAIEQLNKTKDQALRLQKRALSLSTQLSIELKTLNQRIKQTDNQAINPDDKDATLKALDTINNRLPYITKRITAINTKLDALIPEDKTDLPSLDLPPIRPQHNTLQEVGEAVTSHSHTQNDI